MYALYIFSSGRTPTITGAPSPWGSRPTGDPEFLIQETSEYGLGVPFIPLNALTERRSPTGRVPRRSVTPRDIGDPAIDVVIGGSLLGPLEIGIEAVELSPCHTGLAGPSPTRLRR